MAVHGLGSSHNNTSRYLNLVGGSLFSTYRLLCELCISSQVHVPWAILCKVLKAIWGAES